MKGNIGTWTKTRISNSNRLVKSLLKNSVVHLLSNRSFSRPVRICSSIVERYFTFPEAVPPAVDSIVYHWLYSNLMVELALVHTHRHRGLVRSGAPLPSILLISRCCCCCWIYIYKALIHLLFLYQTHADGPGLLSLSRLYIRWIFVVSDVVLLPASCLGARAWFPLQSHKCLITGSPNSICAPYKQGAMYGK